jgi:hypothetical protein
MKTRYLASGCAFALALCLCAGARAQPKVTVNGDATCPSPDMINAALHGIGLDIAWLPHAVMVDVSPERLSLTLGGDRSARREIPAAADCQTRAESIAVVIRAWSGDLPAHPTSAPMLTVAAPATEPELPETEESEHVFELDGAVFFSALWGRTPGGWLAVGLTPYDGGLGFRVFSAIQSAQDVSLAEGQNHLLRVMAGAAPTFHLQGEKLFASADLGLLVTFTRAKGGGYTSNQSAHAWNLGAVGDVRGGVQSGRWRVWMNTRLLGLFHRETIALNGDGATASLKSWDLQLGVGVGFRFE